MADFGEGLPGRNPPFVEREPKVPAGVRNLFRAALVIFVVTIVIGILNGIDAWDVPRNTLLTHVHAGTLGWITLSVFAAAIWMLAEPGASTGRMANFAIVALTLYILAFWSVDLTDTVSIQRPIGGILAFIAMTWVFVWAVRSRSGKGYDIAQLGLVLSLLFLVIGAVLGVLLGLQLAEVSVVAQESTDRLAESHPGAMVIGFVVLAAVALIEWLIQDRSPSLRESRAGVVQMILVFLAGLSIVIGGLVANEQLLQLGVPLQILGTLILLWRHRARLGASHWGPGVVPKFVRTAVIGLVAVVAFVAYIVNQFVGGAEFTEVVHVLVAMDHTNFLLVMTSLIFAMMARGSEVSEPAAQVIYWGLVAGAVGFVFGLVLESAPLKRVFTPILGVALLYGIFTYLRASERRAV
jgi:hypothetical protein